jgi:NADH:ubiquinone oxidoreductase subunit 3 (subunit A)
MHTQDFALMFLLTAQPLFLFCLLFLLTHRSLNQSSLFSRLFAIRQRTRSVRFFECAAHSRLVSQLRYSIQVLSLLVLFIIYDVDLLFFLSEALMADS